MAATLGIFYTGEERFREQTKANHQHLLDLISNQHRTQVYWFTQPNFDRAACPYYETERFRSGGIQIWDFVSAAEQMTEPVIIKMRTDVWFAKSCINVVLEMISRVMSKEFDLVYLGSELYENFDAICNVESANIDKIQDFVIIARKDAINNLSETVDRYMHMKPNKSGNKVFQALIKKPEKSITVRCQMYLMRKIPEQLIDGEVAYGFVERYLLGKNFNDNVIDYFTRNKNSKFM